MSNLTKEDVIEICKQVDEVTQISNTPLFDEIGQNLSTISLVNMIKALIDVEPNNAEHIEQYIKDTYDV